MVETPWLPFVWDVNNDGFFTISDVALWIQQAFFMPGDTIIWLLLRFLPVVARFLELTPASYGGTLSALASLLVWTGVAVVFLIVTHYIAEVDRAISEAIRGIFTAATVKFRTMKVRLASWRKRRRDRSRRDGQESVIRDLELTPEEVRILTAHAHVTPPGMIALSDLVRATGVPRIEVMRLLARLQDLKLIAFSAGAEAEAGGYSLTDSGQRVVSIAKLSVSFTNKRQ